MDRLSFIKFLVAARVTKWLPWNAIARIAPEQIAGEIRLAFAEITIRSLASELAKNIAANNALWARLKRG